MNKFDIFRTYFSLLNDRGFFHALKDSTETKMSSANPKIMTFLRLDWGAPVDGPKITFASVQPLEKIGK